MPHPTSTATRLAIWLGFCLGQTCATIAQAVHVSARTVRRLLRGFRQAGQPTRPAYQACGRPRTPDREDLRQQVLALRRLHAGWGAGRIVAELRQSGPRQHLPARSTVKRWLAQAGLAPRRSRRTHPPAPRAVRVHQVWQMDACERVRLRSGAQVCWLRLVDEASGAVLGSWVFPQGSWTEVGKHAVQAALREAFARWGRPEALRVDHGIPWVSPGGLPSDLELWLAGLQVLLYCIPVRCPQENGKVERSQGTARRWAEPEQCDSPEELQRRLHEEDRVQREVYVGADGQTRRQRHPELLHSGRGYSRLWESVAWELAAALACLRACVVVRKVNQLGQVSLYDQHHRVGACYAGQRVEVQFAVDSCAWCFVRDGVEVGRSAAGQITEARIVGLSLGSRQGRSKRERLGRRVPAEAGQPGGNRVAG